MVDGLGIPPSGWRCSFFQDISREFTDLLDGNSIPSCSQMGVEGIPQSATGQTSLFTGENSSAEIGYHLQGFPGPRLREMIVRNNIFKFLLGKGMSVAFANAYVKYSLDELRNMNLRSVSTVMVESAIGWARNIESLLSGKAVYHDITGESIEAENGVKPIKPEKAAENLLSIAENNDFTLFEYFLTDRVGHKRDMKSLVKYFSELGRFVVEITKGLGSSSSLMLTSDHGNVEDMDVRTHTRNPVPFMTINANIGAISNTKIEDIFSIITTNLVGKCPNSSHSKQ